VDTDAWTQPLAAAGSQPVPGNYRVTVPTTNYAAGSDERRSARGDSRAGPFIGKVTPPTNTRETTNSSASGLTDTPAFMVPLTPHASQAAIDWGATTRDLASVRIWAQVTGGDYVFAPLLRPDPTSRTGVNPRTPEIQHRWTQLAHHPHGHYARLRDYLDHYAQHLTARLDHGHDPDPAPHPHPHPSR
jgi:hypothetical protein